MNNPLLQSPIMAMLKDLEAELNRFGVDFYLVGAVARDYHLSAKPDLSSSRITDDVDIAVMLNDAGQFNKIKAAILDTGNFVADETEPIKLFYKGQLEIDLLPFGAIQAEDGHVFLQPPNLFTLDLPGFAEVYPFVESVAVDGDFSVKVCPVEGIVILKLIASYQDPSRTKDILDIGHMTSVYFELADQDIYEDHFDVMDSYDTAEAGYLTLVSARVIGRKMQEILRSAPLLQATITTQLKKRNEPWAEPMLMGLQDNPRSISHSRGR